MRDAFAVVLCFILRILISIARNHDGSVQSE